MNRMISSRLSIIAVFLIFPMTIVGCQEIVCEACGLTCLVLTLGLIPLTWACMSTLCYGCMSISAAHMDASSIQAVISQLCDEYPDECAVAFRFYQNGPIPFCEDYPDECQQAFDAWVEALDTAEE